MMPKSGIDTSRVSPTFFIDLADPLGEVYRNCEEALLENIAKHFNVKADETYSFKWQVKKLSELGRLSRENVKIIAQAVSGGDEMTRLALEQSMLRAIAEVEPDLLDASRAGLIGEAPPPSQSERLHGVMDAYQAQAVDKLNLVNTVMLNSSLDQYRKTVANVGMYEQQLAAAQEILNERTGEIVTGQTSLREAVRRGVQDLARTGLTGFTDRAGHAWSPEAYVTMDLRTTAHNVAIECVRARMGDYGTQIFQVSEHVGARPKCAPHQGKCYAWDNTAGEIEDGIGNRIRFEPLSSTSYGQPDGLFGINCGHRPIVVIPGRTIVRKRIQQSEAENAEAYKLSQQQRRLEREVRGAKREAALLKASGDSEGFKQAAQKVARRNAAMTAFIDDTGRTRRRDREQVVGFDRSLSASVNAMNRVPSGGRKSIKPKPKTSTLNYQCDLAQKFGKDHYEQMRNRVSGSPSESLRKVWEKYEKDIAVGDAAYSGNAYCRGNTLYLNGKKDAAGSWWQKSYQVSFHESGHAIDYLARSKAGGSTNHYSSRYKNGLFPKTIKDEVASLVSAKDINLKTQFKAHANDYDWLHQNGYIESWEYNYWKQYGVWAKGPPKYSKSMAYAAVEKEIKSLNSFQKGNLSDIMEGATGGKISIGFGHGAKYWKDRTYNGVADGLATEAFAEMLDSALANPESLSAIQTYLPKSYAVFEDMMYELAK